jgi:circadian clock protein KaiC
LHFLIEGADRGERGLMVGFHEMEDDLSLTADGIGLDLRHHAESGMIQMVWNPPLELSADDWAWQVLRAVDAHAPARIFIDAITDVQRIMTAPDRMALYVTALVNELRRRDVTAFISAEIDEYTDEKLTVPIPAASAGMDNCILLRHVEYQGHLRRLVALPKVRQSETDPSIREMRITHKGMVVTSPFSAASGLLMGRATPVSEPTGDNTT